MKLFHSILFASLFLLAGNTFASNHSFQTDTIKYRGYRVELYNFEVLKKTDDWVKVRFAAVNTGRMAVKLETKTLHWVQFNFDQSIFSEKLGGYREHIQYQLARDGFKLDIAELKEKVEVKFPVILPAAARVKSSPPVVKKETNSASSKKKPPAREVPIFAPPSDKNNTSPVHPDVAKNPEPRAEVVKLKDEPKKIDKPEKICPDILFKDLRIIKEDEKWATLEYTIVNEGEGTFHLFETAKGKDDGLIIRAYISGVETLSRGALPIGGQIVQPGAGVKNELKKGDEYKAQLKLDIRKKTRYMKSLILKLDGAQYAIECDRKNNTAAVILR